MEWAVWVGIASGVAVLLLGALILGVRARRPGSKFFAAFALVWGIEIAAFNALDIVPAPLIDRIVAAGIGLIAVETLFLTHFVVRFAGRVGPPWIWASKAAAVLALVTGLGLAVRPQWFVAGGTFTPTALVLVLIPNYAALYGALYMLMFRFLEGGSDVRRREITIVFTALAFYAAYTATYNAVQYALDRRFFTAFHGAPLATAFLVLFGVASVFVGFLVFRLVGRAATLADVRERRRHLLVALALAGPAVVGIIAALPLITTGSTVDLTGALRLSAAALMAYGLLKHHIFGIDLQVKAALQHGTVAILFILVFVGVSETVEQMVSSRAGTAAALMAAGLMAVAIRPLERAAGRITDRAFPGVRNTPEYRHTRSHEIYFAAAEVALKDGVISTRERTVLDTLRDQLGIAPLDAQGIEARVAVA